MREQIIKLYAYDEIADWIYQNIQKGDSIYIQGNIEEKGIKICQTFS